ncbi:pilus assembly PilX N-terminal domain-containing protein [Desulfobulbus elongatus]|uniref:pilus assembly PilX N-terminal domain-containing protein n=1 Tax=Desulfobulbus elongatus TaxID=53332 RepID=UPI0004828CB3|nr:pilus assembly PilX N-terminal domain-containing protein [Desulfobulbus elongatus]
MNNENGFVLVGALLIMTLLVLIGISATTSSVLELQISGADRIHAETFYQADSGTQIAVRLIEESLGATEGFTNLTSDGGFDVLKDPDPDIANSTIVIGTKDLWRNEGVPDEPTDADRDIAYFPEGFNPAAADASLRTNVTLAGLTTTVEGEGLQMVAGYEGKGKGTAGGGGKITYTIHSRHFGRSNSETNIQVAWLHVIGLELEGRY